MRTLELEADNFHRMLRGSEQIAYVVGLLGIGFQLPPPDAPTLTEVVAPATADAVESSPLAAAGEGRSTPTRHHVSSARADIDGLVAEKVHVEGSSIQSIRGMHRCNRRISRRRVTAKLCT